MAEKRGGYRSPKGGPRASGVGKNSERSDAAQPIRVPNVQDSTDLSMGDRRKLEEGQRIAPVGRAAAPRLSPPPASTGSGGASPMGLPDYLATMPSSRPDEPVTAGLPFGPGSGPEALTPPDPTDDMEVVLQGIVQLTGDQAIANMLSDHREFKAWKTQRDNPAPAPVTPLAAVPDSVPAQEFEPEVSEEFGLATEEEPLEAGGEEPLSVETPASAPPEGGVDEPGVLPPTTGGDPEVV